MPILIVCCAWAANVASAAASASVMRTMVPPPKEAVPYQKVKRSTEKILSTHVGSLPYESGGSVDWVVRKQRELGLDLVNEGEYTKGGDWLSYVEERFGGFEPRPPAPGAVPLIAQGKDREAFADFYKYAAEKGTLFYAPGEQIKRVRPIWVCTAPITYTGQASLEREIAELKRHVPVEDAFLTSTAPASLEVYRRNEYYKTEEEFVFAIAEAMRVEFEAIVRSGVVTHSTDVIEHPEVVAQRIQRFAGRVGKENVIAGCDCGFGGRSHPQIAWAKLKALSDGAALASKALF